MEKMLNLQINKKIISLKEKKENNEAQNPSFNPDFKYSWI